MLALVTFGLCCLPAPDLQATEAGARREPARATTRATATLSEARLQELDGAARRGLAWLAEQQLEAGCWTGIVGHKMNHDYVVLGRGLPVSSQRSLGRGHMGVTALCGMAFLAGGHLPDRGPHGATVKRAVDYVLTRVGENGLIEDSGTRMYSHAFATLFLAQVYGISGSRRVKTALEKAVNMIVDCQNRHGAWRYNPFSQAADLSVTVCQLQSLRAARNIGIKVPKTTVDAAVDYVLRSRTEHGRNAGLYFYKIHGRSSHTKNTEYAINAAAVTALHSAGIYSPELCEPALSFLEDDYRRIAAWPGHYYHWYGNYYAAQAFFQTGGPRWERYFERISSDLLGLQQARGCWENDVGPGDEFSTAVACMILQIPKQYLPIFQR